MNGDLKTRKMTRATLPISNPSQASEKENADVAGAPQEKQTKTVRFDLCTMDFRRRIKSDCNVIAEAQRAPMCDLQLNLPGKNARRDEQARVIRRSCRRTSTATSSRVRQQTISSAAKVAHSKQDCKETQQAKPTAPKIPSEQFNKKNTKSNKQQKDLIAKAEVKHTMTSTEIQEKATIISRLPAPKIFTSTLFIQPLKQLSGSVQVQASKKKFRPRAKSLNADARININMPSYNVAKAPSGYKDDLSSPVVTVEPIIQGVMSPIKPNIFTTQQTLLAQCPLKPAARKETLVRKARDNRKIYEPVVFYKNFYVSDYSEDVIAYLLQNERRHMVQKNYLQIYDVNPANRACIIDWLMQIQVRYKISINTFLLGIRLFDALLASVHIPKNMYQLISLTLLWVIHKFDSNTRIIHVKNLVSGCYNAYNPVQFLHMEQKVLKFFNFDYNLPEPTSYLFYYSENLNIKSEVLIQSACYILESYTLTEEYSTIPPSLLAAAALHLNFRVLFILSTTEVENAWEELRNNLGYYDIQTIRPVQDSMQVQIKKINNAEYEYQEVYNKYKIMKWFQIFQTKLQAF